MRGIRVGIARWRGALATALAGLVFGLAAGLAQAQSSLTVGLYPYVPRYDQFVTAITQAWAQEEPSVTLNFLPESQWDGGYSMNPPADADVFVFDAMYLETFRTQNFLEAIAPGEVEDAADILSYAREGVQSQGNYYAIPLLGCSNVLFYHQDDGALAAAETFGAVVQALQQCTYTSQVPPDVRGIMVDMSGGTTNASLYLDIQHALDGVYLPTLPPNEQSLDAQAIAEQKTLMATASFYNATVPTANEYEHGTWFSEGYGRAVVGYTEYMSAMSAETRASIAFKPMPFGDGSQPPLFYADVIGVNTTTNQRGTRDLAVKLANLMASSDVVVASIGAAPGKPEPQYLMATRASAFDTLGQQFPIYQRMYALVTDNDPLLFKLPANARSWFDSMKGVIRGDVRANYQCGCDFKAATYIADNTAAQSICPTTCSGNGGWNGQWTNVPPAAPAGSSVCGCNACPVQAMPHLLSVGVEREKR
ncbi:thiamine pyridinylase [Aquibium sp. A9E412]|uniref:thiamine pyridinylase n=1 Tax=Aquibium sp. A9E412 TaxID=2976767 RepID=UPI0025B0F37A|nr:thiamine pyridinylase [Aquibium sp. A9E412]MDN2566329.1 thiamine pyridinylase [Aquibium sp. A9E412]